MTSKSLFRVTLLLILLAFFGNLSGQMVDFNKVKWTRNSNMTGSVLIDKKGSVTIEPAQNNSFYDGNSQYWDILITGPLLITKKRRTQLLSYYHISQHYGFFYDNIGKSL